MPHVAVTFTATAENDLDDIWLHIALDSPAAADRTIDAVKKRIEQLASFPESGQARPDIASDARSLNTGNYLILYRIIDVSVEIVRVAHGARDLTELF